MLWQWESVSKTGRLQSSHSGIKIKSFSIFFVLGLVIKFFHCLFTCLGRANLKFLHQLSPFSRKFLIDINKQCTATESAWKLSSIKAIEINETKQSSLSAAAAKKQFRDDYHRIIVFMLLNRINMHFMFSRCFTNKRKKPHSCRPERLKCSHRKRSSAFRVFT